MEMQTTQDMLQRLIWGVYAEQVQLQEVAVCFGGQLMRGNRCQKVNANSYQAFDSPTYHKLALLGVEVDWQARYLLQVLPPLLQCLTLVGKHIRACMLYGRRHLQHVIVIAHKAVASPYDCKLAVIMMQQGHCLLLCVLA